MSTSEQPLKEDGQVQKKPEPSKNQQKQKKQNQKHKQQSVAASQGDAPQYDDNDGLVTVGKGGKALKNKKNQKNLKALENILAGEDQSKPQPKKQQNKHANQTNQQQNNQGTSTTTGTTNNEKQTETDPQHEVDQGSHSFEISPKANIYVKHIPLNQTEEELEAFFKSMGEIISFKLQTNELGHRTGVAFVQYRLQEDALRAIQQTVQRQWYAQVLQPRHQRHVAYHSQQRALRRRTQQGGQRQHYNQNVPVAQATPSTADDERQKLGEQLYWLVQKIDPQQTPKITGMLLDMLPDEVNQILKNPVLLQEKVKEVQDILKSYSC